MTIFDILTLVFGVALFLFGMNLMGETLKKSAGRKLKIILGKLTASPVKGFLLGLVVTCIIQSSSATTVMVVGFVNSGTMALMQALTVIMGANVGTCITSWITALSGIEGGGAGWVGAVMEWFKPSTFTPIIALIGLLFYMGGKNDRKKNTGLILLGFSVLMIGMETMSDAVKVMAENETFRNILVSFENPLLGLLAGLVLTAVVQSSSASIGILQSFTVTGAITFGSAIPIIMGFNIGTCVTALISSVGTNRDAKRASVFHLIFNIFGAALCMVIFYILKYAVQLPLLDGNINMWGIAIVHTVTKLGMALIMFPIYRQLGKLAVALVKDKKVSDKFSMLDERLLSVPAVAIERSNEAVTNMAHIAENSVLEACKLFDVYDQKLAEKIKEYEDVTDEYEDKLGTYLVRLSETSILDGENQEINKLLHTIGDLERISDHALNLAESAEELNDKEIKFSEQAKREISVLINAVTEIMDLAIEGFCNNDFEKAYRVEPLEQVIDDLRDDIKKGHIVRLQAKECSIEHGFVLADILNNLERIADHCSNIAGCVVEISRYDALDLHKYIADVKHGGDEFDQKYNAYKRKYSI